MVPTVMVDFSMSTENLGKKFALEPGNFIDILYYVAANIQGSPLNKQLQNYSLEELKILRPYLKELSFMVSESCTAGDAQYAANIANKERLDE